jgi:hypothetical protein
MKDVLGMGPGRDTRKQLRADKKRLKGLGVKNIKTKSYKSGESKYYYNSGVNSEGHVSSSNRYEERSLKSKISHFLGSADDFMKSGGTGFKAVHDYYDGLVIGGDNFRSNIETIINETTDGNFEPIVSIFTIYSNTVKADKDEPSPLPSNATELGEVSFSVIPIVLTKGRNAKSLELVKAGTKEWQMAVQAIRNNKKSHYRVETATDARNMLFEAQGNMNRYKQYAKDKGVTYKKGYETHNNQNSREINVGNDLQHIKWKNGKSGGHIYFDQPN